MGAPNRAAFVHGVPVGAGGLGVQAGNALRALALCSAEVHAIGPGFAAGWNAPPNVVWHQAPRSWTPWLGRTPLRRQSGLVQHLSDLRIARFARSRLAKVGPDLCYAFTQVALEPLLWARANGVTSIVENPNGHIRAFRRVYVDQTRRWCGRGYPGHPTRAMVDRVEREYALATHIRVSSQWARRSLVEAGIAAERITVLQQSVDLDRFAPSGNTPARHHALRICFVGSLDLRKGFVYLLRAARAAGSPVEVTFVGATGDRAARQLLERERHGVSLQVTPGDPRPALAGADLFVLPTLEDGSPFAVAEAMACGVPVVTTTCTGAAEWITPGHTGWVVEPASETALAAALDHASGVRGQLRAMGLAARAATERRVEGADQAVADWIARL